MWERGAGVVKKLDVLRRQCLRKESENLIKMVCSLFPLSAPSLCCACVGHSQSLMAHVVQSAEKHTLEKGAVKFTSCPCLVFDFSSVVAGLRTGEQSSCISERSVDVKQELWQLVRGIQDLQNRLHSVGLQKGFRGDFCHPRVPAPSSPESS